MKEFIYFPSFDTGTSRDAAKKNIKLNSGLGWRFWLDSYPEKYRHKAYLISAGHSSKKPDHAKQYEFTDDTIVMGDSGGYQIATGAMKWDLSIRDQIFTWLENNSNIAMNLDIPTRGQYAGQFEKCLEISLDNFKYFADKQSGKTDFLNIIQGSTYEKYKKWYQVVKGLPFQGWAMGGAQGNVSSFISGIAVLAESGELFKDENKWFHILGTSSVLEFLMLAQLQKSLDDAGSKITITTDSSTPSRTVSYGFYYTGYDLKSLNFSYIHLPRKEKWQFDKHRVTTMPIFNEIDEQIWDTYTLEEFLEWKSVHYGWLVSHNFAVFKDSLRLINNVVNNDPYILEQYVTKETLMCLNSIDDIVKSSNPSAILHKNSQIYNSLSRKIAVSHDTNNDFF